MEGGFGVNITLSATLSADDFLLFLLKHYSSMFPCVLFPVSDKTNTRLDINYGQVQDRVYLIYDVIECADFRSGWILDWG